MNRITAQILADPRFTAVADAHRLGLSDRDVVIAIEESGLLRDFSYSEVAEALLCDTGAIVDRSAKYPKY